MAKINKQKMTKQSAYDLVRQKQSKVLKEKHEPLEKELTEKIKKLKIKAIEQVVPKEKIQEIVKTVEETTKALEGIRDDLNYTYTVHNALRYLNDFKEDEIYRTLTNSIEISDPEIERLRQSINEDFRMFNDEFDKIRNHLKALRNGAQCYDFLKSVGFDVTPMEQGVTEYQLAPTKVNKEILGLPEEKSENGEK